MKNYLNSISDNEIIKILESLRWGKNIECPHCNCNKTINYKTENKFQCENCFRSFSVKSKTELENTKLPLSTWLLAYSLINQNNDIDINTLNKWLNVTQKTSLIIHGKIMKMINEKMWLNKITELPFYKNQKINN